MTRLAGELRRTRLRQSQLYLLLSERLCRHPFEETLEAAILGGVDVIQIREKERTFDEFLRFSQRVLEIVAGRALVVVNDCVETASRLPMDGVHLGQADLPLRDARLRIGEERLLGISTHDAAEVRAALPWADYLGFGTVFPSRTRGNLAGIGPDAAAAATTLARHCPVFAIGGITIENIEALVGRGVRRVAVCEAILSALDPEAIARSFKEALDPASEAPTET